MKHLKPIAFGILVVLWHALAIANYQSRLGVCSLRQAPMS